ncbi:hypothetical protein B4089_3765 [Bacillus licheniformis]|nr:hypothetical protein B4089_3765 [Bacillus licheniformis]
MELLFKIIPERKSNHVQILFKVLRCCILTYSYSTAQCNFNFAHYFSPPSFNPTLNFPLITDVRLPAEAKRCKEEGYFVVRIVSPLEQRKERMRKEGDLFNDDVFTSEAEKYIDSLDVDYEIVNDGTLEDFKAKMSVAVEKIIGYSRVL